MPRKKPFSGKQKKKQIQEKRDRKKPEGSGQRTNAAISHRSRQQSYELNSSEEERGSGSDTECAAGAGIPDVNKLNQQPISNKKQHDPNRFRLHFEKDSRAEVERRKKQSMQPFEILPEEALEVDLGDIYQPGSVLDMPKRPTWNYSLSKEQVEAREEAMFQEYLHNIFSKYSSRQLSYFEINLETWRQLWRVLEMSDIVLLITDIRHPALHFSPALYDYVTKELRRHLILVLNKIDLAPPSLVVAWLAYMKERFPDVHVVRFTSFPRENLTPNSIDPGKVLHRKRRKGAYTAVGPMQLLKACQTVCQGRVDLSSWSEKIEAELRGEEGLAAKIIESTEAETVPDTSFSEHTFFRDGVLTIGCVGHPNVGKSSLMNGLCGRKVVSASRTPGHTKHFQTIFLTPTVKLCDSPGLVFPSLVDRQLQILSGMFPVAQVQEPYTAVGYLAQRVNLIPILKIKHPLYGSKPKEGETEEWSAWDICEAWAEKRGFMTSKAARHDVYRAANNLLRLAVEGRLCLCMRPPGYTNQKEQWEQHPETLEISKIQEQHKQLNPEEIDQSEFTSSGGEESDADIESNEVERDTDTRRRRRRKAREDSEGDRLVATSNKFALLSAE
ncbi:guanine nucleotide-binding protein-like 1 [Patiria miniata]|uniref:Guanine nucleotide-binding protein-like 1 n=1 Tax=Patiria miniata TaxID=46514 RepID=A0A914AII9_PATMI|nr:guanine nucleotide-binding protein-like 1 [Patiria miniata]